MHQFACIRRLELGAAVAFLRPLRLILILRGGLRELLLGAERLGITLSDEWQLEPEQSTSAVVVLNPHAKYFTV